MPKRNLYLAGFRILLLVCSLSLTFFIIESMLRIHQYVVDKKALAQSSNVAGVTSADEDGLGIIPKKYQKRVANVEGVYAYYWQDVLHVLNEDNMRRTAPFPPKKDNVFRIMVVGDSLTYGEGVEVQNAYSSVIEKMLDAEYNVEVLNLGVMGADSEYILSNITTFLPNLDPDLIVYGVCLNDYNPSESRAEENYKKYQILFPESLKQLLAEHTLTGKLVKEKYNDALIKVGLRENFIYDVLYNIEHTKVRFARDVKEMNDIVVRQGLPPVLTMVLNQFPQAEGSYADLTRTTEQILHDAGMKVISSDRYIRQYDGQNLSVNQWEKHPNEKAHKIFADYFVQFIHEMPQLKEYKKTDM